MKCPDCRADSWVLETRDGYLRRRRCYNDHRFTTVEMPMDMGLAAFESMKADAEQFRRIRSMVNEKPVGPKTTSADAESP